MTDNRQTILIVDDILDEIAVLEEILKKDFHVISVMSGQSAIDITRTARQPDLILLDIMMPGMDGYDTCRMLNNDPKTSDIPIIFLTAKSGPANEKIGFDLGAEDYITKPFSPSIVMARVRTHLRSKNTRDFLKDKSLYLEGEVNRRIKEISLIQDVTMIALGSLAEMRDNETGNHIRRTQNYIKILAQKLSDHPRFRGQLSIEIIERLYKSAPLHDIGKVGIPDRILRKPGPITTEEFTVMKTHTTIGHDAILKAERSLDTSVSFLALARDIAWAHHEKWDGSGYPRGLSGEKIPLAGRLMAIPDVYDALISKRVYKNRYSHEESVGIIQKGIGSHFDPVIGNVFMACSDRFMEVAETFSDNEKIE